MKAQALHARLRFPAVAVLIAALGLAACTPARSLNAVAAGYTVIDSGLVGGPNDKPYWLNDDEILYVAQTDERRFHKNANVEYRAFRATIWNVRTGQTARMQEITGALCYRDGYIASWWQDQSDPGRDPGTETFGRLGEPLRTVAAQAGKMQYDPATCRPKTESPPAKPLPAWTKGKTVQVLDEIDAILVLDGEKEKSLRNRPVSFHPQGAATGIPMPFDAREHHIQGYHPFKGAYFVLGSHFVKVPGHPDGGYAKSPWPQGVAQPYWWLYPDGHLESGQLVANQLRNVSETVPYRGGYVWHGGPMGQETLFRADERSDTAVARGFAQQMTTSPDGCRIAMNHRRSVNDPWTMGTLKVIELCKGERP